MRIKRNFGEVITAMVTPFCRRDKNHVDFEGVARLANHLLKNGTDTLLINGSTGEGPQLTAVERISILDAVRERTPEGTKIIVSTGSSNTDDTIKRSCHQAYDVGADAVLISVPAYIKPPQKDLFIHFDTIAKASPKMPIIIYNIPGRAAAEILPETVAQLARENPNIIGIKQSMGDMDKVSEMKALCPPNFQIYSGDDSLTLPMLSLGAKGVISVASHLEGPLIKEMVHHFKSGHVKQATEIHHLLFPLCKALFMTSNPIPIKEALYRKGMIKSADLRTLSRMSPLDKKVFGKELTRFEAQKQAFLMKHAERERS
ncbi:MAG: 4-hydroxy-tetrahydrodipicolinate synthase [Alphaproteobacteria bacterium]|nr:4-hydroxy-tetrahydrodipicolinate synthase [Alphaproteobacteria bacterium]